MASGDVLIDVTCDVKENEVTAGQPVHVVLMGQEYVTFTSQQILNRTVDLLVSRHTQDPEKDSHFQSEKQYRVVVTEV